MIRKIEGKTSRKKLEQNELGKFLVLLEYIKNSVVLHFT